MFSNVFADDPDLNSRLDDEFLLRFLRARKFDYDSSFQMVGHCSVLFLTSLLPFQLLTYSITLYTYVIGTTFGVVQLLSSLSYTDFILKWKYEK